MTYKAEHLEVFSHKFRVEMGHNPSFGDFCVLQIASSNSQDTKFSIRVYQFAVSVLICFYKIKNPAGAGLEVWLNQNSRPAAVELEEEEELTKNCKRNLII